MTLLDRSQFGKRRFLARAGGALVAFGAGVDRFAIAAAGRASALDPRATIVPQKDSARARVSSRPGFSSENDETADG
jgi:hypothetical protein